LDFFHENTTAQQAQNQEKPGNEKKRSDLQTSASASNFWPVSNFISKKLFKEF
jgi:hypothetical protein